MSLEKAGTAMSGADVTSQSAREERFRLDHRLPEEQPGTPWNMGDGVRMAYSVILAEGDERRTSQSGSSDSMDGQELDAEGRVEATRLGVAALRAARADGLAGSLKERLSAVVDGFGADGFAERFKAELEGVREPD